MIFLNSFYSVHHTSNDVFSRVESVDNMATIKVMIQLDNKLELGTSYRLKLGPR